MIRRRKREKKYDGENNRFGSFFGENVLLVFE